MSKLKYSKDHEWLLINGDGTATVGITDFAQQELGDVVYVELPELEREIAKDDDVSVVESVKAASDIKAPASGKIVAVNEQLEDAPETINSDPLGEGWIYKLELLNNDEVTSLMDEAAYNDFTASLS